MPLVGGVTPSEILLTGTTEAVETPARQAVGTGVQILAPECAVPLFTMNMSIDGR